MGKKARQAEKKIKVDDAADVIGEVRRWAASPPADPVLDWVRGVSWNIMNRWERSPVVLRTDSEFVGALLNSNADVDLVPDWRYRPRTPRSRGGTGTWAPRILWSRFVAASGSARRAGRRPGGR